MELVAIVTALALIVYIYIAFQVGSARGKYDVPAPAITGHPTFERLYRVQMNTLEQLIIFLPSIWFFGLYLSAPIGAAIGLVWIVGRIVYLVSYVKDPGTRTLGFMLTFAANVILLLGGLFGAIRGLA